jgi:Fe-S-cluster-containing hydrogenase component 2
MTQGALVPGKRANIDFNTCSPESCDPDRGECNAVLSCTHRLLEQEERFESPLLVSATMCVGCGDCMHVCPLGAINIERG